MKILLVGFNLSGAMGDGFRYFLKNLPEYDNGKFDWYGLTIKECTEKYTLIQMLYVCYKKKNIKKLIQTCIQIKKYIEKIKPDKILILTPNLIFNSLIGILYNEKIIYLLHDPIPHEGESIFRKIVLKLQNGFMVRRAKKIVVASENLVNMISNKRIRKKTYVIELGLLNNLIYPEFQSYKKEIDILFFGRIEKYKGLDILVNALNELNKQGKMYTCEIIGKGNISEYILDANLNNIHIVNEYVSDKELAKKIAKSKVVVLPYRTATGTQTIQTAYYYFCPVIASNVGCFIDYVKNNQTGKIFQSGDYIDLAKKIQEIFEQNEYENYKLSITQLLESKFSEKRLCEKYYQLIQ